MTTDTETVMFSVSEISLAAFIAMCLDTNPSYAWTGDQCMFQFEPRNRTIELMSDYLSGNARVEPREYQMRVGMIKKEMHVAYEEKYGKKRR